MTLTSSQIVHEKAQLLFWWCGIAFALLFFGSLWLLMGVIPPPSPTLSGAELVALYEGHAIQLRIGIIVGIVASSLMIPWSAGIAMQVHRMEQGRQFPLFTLLSFGAGVANAVFFIIPFMFWAATFYRMERAPELILLLNDLTWLEFVMIFPPFSIQWLCVAFAGFGSVRQNVLPRWFLFMCVWMAVLGAPGLFAIFFYDGPFAWNGIIGFWVPIGSYTIFLSCFFYVFYRAIKNHKYDIEV